MIFMFHNHLSIRMYSYAFYSVVTLLLLLLNKQFQQSNLGVWLLRSD